MFKTRFTDLTGCKVPIQQASIGGLARPQLATAVSNAGGLGMVYAGSFDPNQMTEVFGDMRRLRSQRDSRTGGDSIQACEGCRVLLSPTRPFAGGSSARGWCVGFLASWL